MPRYIAFLRAINVGGHTVKMDRLREIFESLGFANVETFIASGNVVFETTALDTAALETRIAAALQAALGYEVATFIRTEAELARIAAHRLSRSPNSMRPRRSTSHFWPLRSTPRPCVSSWR